MHLTDRRPQLDAAALAARFVPPPRFADTRFDNYRSDPAFPSQALAVSNLRAFAQSLAPTPSKRSWLWRRSPGEQRGRAARYLDGGFGVGKTHLLASLWHSAPAPKAYLTFTELTAFIGFVGMAPAVQEFRHHGLLCIDEFELDDIANTLMVVSFLRGVMGGPIKLAVTSNTVPDRLGDQRFSAHDFRREIAVIADHFDEIRVDGADYRVSHSQLTLHQLDEAESHHIAEDSFPPLLAHLRTVHPVQIGALFDGVTGVRLSALAPIADQDDALRFVHFVDKLYDAKIPAEITGCDPADVFHPSYRMGGYLKKYGRAESRLMAMREESKGRL